jgi:hypothetical protein
MQPMNTIHLSIVPIYASLLALLFIYLSVLVVKQRRLHRVAIGDGHKPSLKRAIAVQNNFAQYVPFSLLLLSLMEINHAPAYFVHTLCALLLFARCLHAYGVSQEPEPFRYRKIGILTTFGVLATAALCLLYSAWFA